MRIGILTQYFKPEMGAAQNRLYELVQGLQNLGNEIYVVTGMPNYPSGKIFDKYKKKFTYKEDIEGTEIKRYWLYASNSRKTIPRIWNMLSFSITSFFSLSYLRRKKLDYLIVESPPLTLAWTGRWLSKFIGAKFIANISDLWPLSAKELGAISEGRIYRLLEKLERNIYTHSDIAMGQSEEIVDYISKHGGKLTYLFRNGVDPTRFDLSLKKPNDKNSNIKIIYAGLLGYAQGIADICRSINFKELGAEFHIYGNGGEQKEIMNLIEANPENGIFYHGVVTREELPLILMGADMALVPLVKNIFGAVPSKIYEAMAAGLPILFIGEGEGAKIIKDHKLGFIIHSKDFTSLRNIIKNASMDREMLQKMSNNCRQAANNNFNRPKQIVQLNKFLEANLN
ncbi:MAG: glycosyltransferase family 4 protein [Muribaculaceae bacterium]|nr:glycosyltransferase family 4 protein [Muribaculaceae bacterium]